MAILPGQLDMAMNPSVVAVVGSRRADDYLWLRSLETFKGKVYSVQIDPNDISGIEEMGISNYKSLLEIPDDVDYVIVAVPRRAVPSVLEDAVAKGVRTVHVFTAGFAETGSTEGLELEERIAQIAKEAGILVIGPNCVGLYDPTLGMRFHQYQEVTEGPGPLTVIGQSGGHTAALIQGAQASGVGINKAVSFGNGVLLDSPELIRYFGKDPATQIICAYIEGPRDVRSLFQVLRETTPHKPVVLWKGGQTEDGQRAAASHTGALAGSTELWDALTRQTGAIRADSVEDALDVIKALAYLKPTTGDGVGIIGGTGGQSVSMSDDFSRAGLRVPLLSQHTLDTIGNFFQLIGASYYNPVDVGGINKTNLESIIEMLALDPQIDVVALMAAVQAGPQRSFKDMVANLEIYGKTKERVGKPFLAMMWAPIPYRDGAILEELDKALQDFGIPIFPSPQRAARALKNLVDYYRFRRSVEDDGIGLEPRGH